MLHDSNNHVPLTQSAMSFDTLATDVSMSTTWTHSSLFVLPSPALNRARRQSGFPTFISCQRQDANVLPKRWQSHQGDKLCDVSTVPLVARWPVFLARGSDADSEPHFKNITTVFSDWNTSHLSDSILWSTSNERSWLYVRVHLNNLTGNIAPLSSLFSQVLKTNCVPAMTVL